MAIKVTFDRDLGFAEKLDYVDQSSRTWEGHIHFTFCHSGEVNLISTDPSSAKLCYVAIDTQKYFYYLQSHSPDTIVPDEPADLNKSAWSLNPQRDAIKSANKLSSLKEGLMQASARKNSFNLPCHIISPFSPIFAQGRHRFWLIRRLKLPYFVAAVDGHYKHSYLQLKENELLHPNLHSNAIYDVTHSSLS